MKHRIRLTAAVLAASMLFVAASCSKDKTTTDNTTGITSASAPAGTSSEATSVPSGRLAELAAVDYNAYALSSSDDIKTMEQKIETKYGIDIVFGDAVRTEFGDESENLVTEKYTSEENIKKALISVDEVLKIYPKTFFYQLSPSPDKPVKIYLTGHIKSLTYPDAAINAFTTDSDKQGETYLVIDIAGQDGVFNVVDVMHETVHLTDFKLKQSGLLKETEWSSLNPESFSYRDKSGKDADERYNFSMAEFCPIKAGMKASDVYFVCPYSQANEFEDRATMMTNAMVFTLWNYEVEPNIYKCPHMQAKMEYYFGQIRKGFDTTYWDKTPWEESFSKLK